MDHFLYLIVIFYAIRTRPMLRISIHNKTIKTWERWREKMLPPKNFKAVTLVKTTLFNWLTVNDFVSLFFQNENVHISVEPYFLFNVQKNEKFWSIWNKILRNKQNKTKQSNFVYLIENRETERRKTTSPYVSSFNLE